MFIIILFVTPRLIMYTRAGLCSPGDCQGQTVTSSPPASDAAEQRLGIHDSRRDSIGVGGFFANVCDTVGVQRELERTCE